MLSIRAAFEATEWESLVWSLEWLTSKSWVSSRKSIFLTTKVLSLAGRPNYSTGVLNIYAFKLTAAFLRVSINSDVINLPTFTLFFIPSTLLTIAPTWMPTIVIFPVESSQIIGAPLMPLTVESRWINSPCTSLISRILSFLLIPNWVVANLSLLWVL